MLKIYLKDDIMAVQPNYNKHYNFMKTESI